MALSEVRKYSLKAEFCMNSNRGLRSTGFP
jgi:hypothetical protein